MPQPIIAIIGAGVMGEAILAGIIKKGVTAPDCIHAADTVTDRLEKLHTDYGVQPFTENAAAVQQAQVVILSIKPQQMKKVLPHLRGKIDPQALVISIVAGVPVQEIVNGLNHPLVVRAMPNTPAQIGEGITMWTCAPTVSPEQRELARSILRALGQEIFDQEESYLDMATALSGTGPAYVFLFMEALIDAGVHLGFQRSTAEQLVLQTVRGSVDYYAQKKDHPAHLRNQVTSPAGTSAAALYYLEKAGFRTAISRAIWAAYERSLELGKGRDSQPPSSEKHD